MNIFYEIFHPHRRPRDLQLERDFPSTPEQHVFRQEICFLLPFIFSLPPSLSLSLSLSRLKTQTVSGGGKLLIQLLN